MDRSLDLTTAPSSLISCKQVRWDRDFFSFVVCQRSSAGCSTLTASVAELEILMWSKVLSRMVGLLLAVAKKCSKLPSVSVKYSLLFYAYNIWTHVHPFSACAFGIIVTASPLCGGGTLYTVVHKYNLLVLRSLSLVQDCGLRRLGLVGRSVLVLWLHSLCMGDDPIPSAGMFLQSHCCVGSLARWSQSSSNS